MSPNRTPRVPKAVRRAELERMRGPALIRIALGYNPFAGYSVPHSNGAKHSLIDTIIRFEYGIDAA